MKDSLSRIEDVRTRYHCLEERVLIIHARSGKLRLL